MVNNAISKCVLSNTVLFVCESTGKEVAVHFTACVTGTRKTPVLERDCTSLNGF